MQAESVGLEHSDRARLRRAVKLLERNSLLTMLARAAGRPITAILGSLPNFANDAVQRISQKAILQCLRLALRPKGPHSLLRMAGHYPKAISGIAGALGGFAGLPGAAVELPVTTVVMFQSIAKIAADEGEDLSSPEARLACLEVFALSTDGRGPAATQSGYYATRKALAKSVDEASSYVLRRSTTQETGPVLVQLVTAIASRFGLLVSEELAASAIPVIGAFTGASLNMVFVQHFNNIALGHFTVRALERKYGEGKIREEFEQILEHERARRKLPTKSHSPKNIH